MMEITGPSLSELLILGGPILGVLAPLALPLWPLAMFLVR